MVDLEDGDVNSGFAIRKRHIGIANIRAAFERVTPVAWGTTNVVSYTIQYDSQYGPGLYALYWDVRLPFAYGYVDVWNSLGQKQVSNATFGDSAGSYSGTHVEFSGGL